MRIDLEKFKEYCWNDKPLKIGSRIFNPSRVKMCNPIKKDKTSKST